MLSLNHVTLAGNLTREPEIRLVGTDRPVAAFSLALNRRYKTQEGELKEEVTFVDCEAWGRTAEIIGQYLAKGSPVYVEGRFKLDAWQAKDGQKRSRLKVVVDQVQFLGRRPHEEGAAAPAASASGQAPHERSESSPGPAGQEASLPTTVPAGLDDEPPF